MLSTTDRTGSRILVSAGSRHGATLEIAEQIAAVLREWGNEVDVADPDQVTSLDGYDVVVLGSAVYAGHWVENARRLADLVAESKPRPETWLFSSGPVGDPPVPTEHAVDVSDILHATEARDHRLFGGKIDKSKLSFGEKAILIAVRAPEGDYRDWDEITAWSKDIAERLVGAMSHPTSLVP
ncbi:MAG TPA: flavodoxin domain-containing protein [Acidimicrobiia bacterium]